jgi:hypothetical protein
MVRPSFHEARKESRVFLYLFRKLSRAGAELPLWKFWKERLWVIVPGKCAVNAICRHGDVDAAPNMEENISSFKAVVEAGLPIVSRTDVQLCN